jgi:hypothetical protein
VSPLEKSESNSSVPGIPTGMEIPPAAFPAPRDDEPPDLRARIVAELHDHLQCARQRELVRGGDEIEATRRVLERFGDPARVARQLWFDALWEKIMSQRVLVACCGLMAVSCLAMGGVTWRIAANSADSAAATQALVEQGQTASLVLAQQGREANLALVEKLDRLMATAEAHKSLDWIDVRLRLVRGDENGPPAEGFEIHASTASKSGEPEMNFRSTAAAETQLGLFSPGTYNVRVTSPWGETLLLRPLSVRAGDSPRVVTVVCPTEPPVEGDIRLRIDWPDDLKKHPVGIVVQVHQLQLNREVAGQWWARSSYGSAMGPGGDSTMRVIATSDGQLVPHGFWRDLRPRADARLQSRVNAQHALMQFVVDEFPDSKLRLKGLTHEVRLVEGAILNLKWRPGDMQQPRVRMLVPWLRSEQSDATRIAAEHATAEPLRLGIIPGQVTGWKIDVPAAVFDVLRNVLANSDEGAISRTPRPTP